MKVMMNLKMSKKTIMKDANKIASYLVDYTENYNLAMHYALKDVWFMAKRYNKPYFKESDIIKAVSYLTTAPAKRNHFDGIIPDWFMTEKDVELGFDLEDTVITYKFDKETAKAERAKFHTIYGDYNVWVPKSIMA